MVCRGKPGLFADTLNANKRFAPREDRTSDKAKGNRLNYVGDLNTNQRLSVKMIFIAEIKSVITLATPIHIVFFNALSLLTRSAELQKTSRIRFHVVWEFFL